MRSEVNETRMDVGKARASCSSSIPDPSMHRISMMQVQLHTSFPHPLLMLHWTELVMTGQTLLVSLLLLWWKDAVR